MTRVLLLASVLPPLSYREWECYDLIATMFDAVTECDFFLEMWV